MSYYGWDSSNQAKPCLSWGCSFLFCLKQFMSASSSQARSGSWDVLSSSFNSCHSTAWVSRRGQDGKVTVSLFVPRAEGDKPSILLPKEAQRKSGTSLFFCCFQESGTALTLCFSVSRGYHCTGKVGVRFGPAINKVSMSVSSLAGGKKPRSSCSDLWVFLPEREE